MKKKLLGNWISIFFMIFMVSAILCYTNTHKVFADYYDDDDYGSYDYSDYYEDNGSYDYGDSYSTSDYDYDSYYDDYGSYDYSDYFSEIESDSGGSTAQGAGDSGQSGIGFAVGTKDGESVYQNGTTGELYTVGSDGYKQTLDQGASFTPLTGSQQAAAASGQSQTSQGTTTSYTDSAASGGTSSSSGLFGALGSAVGSVVSGVGSAISSAVGGVSSLLFGTSGTSGYSTTSGTSGYSTTSGSYTTAGGYSAVSTTTSTTGGWNPARYTNTGLPVASIYSIVQNTVMWALSIFGFIGIIGFVISGVWYLLSAGDDTSMKKAKNAMTYSIIGVVVGLIGLVIIFAANALLSGSWYF